MTRVEQNKALFTPSVRREERLFTPGVPYQDSVFTPEIPHTQSTFLPEIMKDDPTIQVISPFENTWAIDLNGQYAMDTTLVRAKAWQISN